MSARKGETAQQREGTLRRGPKLKSDDPRLVGKSPAQRKRLMREHALKYGGLSGLTQTMAQARYVVRKMKTHGELAQADARSLEKSLRVVRAALRDHRDLADLPKVIYEAIAVGFTLAHFARDIADDHRIDGRRKITRDDYFAAKRKARSMKELRYLLDVTMQGLVEFEARELQPVKNKVVK